MVEYLSKSELEKYLVSCRILFCKVQDLPDYAFTNGDIIASKKVQYGSGGGFKYCGETQNFYDFNGNCYGFFELKGTSSIKIEKLGAGLRDNEINDCLVVFISLITKKVVGFYKEATIYKKEQKQKMGLNLKSINKGWYDFYLECCEKYKWTIDGENFNYFLKTEKENATLIPERERFSGVDYGELILGHNIHQYYKEGLKNKKYPNYAEYIKNLLSRTIVR